MNRWAFRGLIALGVAGFGWLFYCAATAPYAPAWERVCTKEVEDDPILISTPRYDPIMKTTVIDYRWVPQSHCEAHAWQCRPGRDKDGHSLPCQGRAPA